MLRGKALPTPDRVGPHRHFRAHRRERGFTAAQHMSNLTHLRQQLVPAQPVQMIQIQNSEHITDVLQQAGERSLSLRP
ncbi:hypothetical protein GCM10011313_29700 [Mycetocola zhadangensis]|nr:hypothetical protein GCM10011313_29700 [Mycetocola zhadangensis]